MCTKLLKFEEDDIETVEETQKNINFYGNMRKPFYYSSPGSKKLFQLVLIVRLQDFILAD